MAYSGKLPKYRYDFGAFTWRYMFANCDLKIIRYWRKFTEINKSGMIDFFRLFQNDTYLYFGISFKWPYTLTLVIFKDIIWLHWVTRVNIQFNIQVY